MFTQQTKHHNVWIEKCLEEIGQFLCQIGRGVEFDQWIRKLFNFTFQVSVWPSGH